MPSLQVLQGWLDEVGAATLAGDWDTYAAHVALPFHLITETSSMVVATEGELRQGFEQFRDTLAHMRITDYLRLADSAVEISPELVSGRYITHLMSGAHRVVPPFRSQATLRLDGGRWRAASIVNALRNTQWPLGVPSVGTHFDGRKD